MTSRLQCKLTLTNNLIYRLTSTLSPTIYVEITVKMTHSLHVAFFETDSNLADVDPFKCTHSIVSSFGKTKDFLYIDFVFILG